MIEEATGRAVATSRKKKHVLSSHGSCLLYLSQRDSWKETINIITLYNLDIMVFV